MDKETQYKLHKMGRHYEKLARGITKQVESEVYQTAVRMAQDPKLSKELRQYAERSITSGTVKRFETVVDQGVQRELSARMDHDMRKGIKDGSIKPADPNDSFVKQMNKAMQQ